MTAVGSRIMHGARHEARAYVASGRSAVLSGLQTLADPGYTDVADVDLVRAKRPAGENLLEAHAQFDTALSAIHAAVERTISHLTT
jgi:hypothetical protein